MKDTVIKGNGKSRSIKAPILNYVLKDKNEK